MVDVFVEEIAAPLSKLNEQWNGFALSDKSVLFEIRLEISA
jgi:hypothetical protein